MELRLTQFRPRIGPREHRVVQPRTPLRHTSLRDPAPYGMLMGDHDGLNRLAGLFSFAAHSRHTIVHVPLRDCVPPDEGCGELVDLVLAHPEAGLRPSKWPELRRALRHGTPLTVGTDEARTERHARAWLERPYDREELRHTTYARTYFLIGGRDVLASVSTCFAFAAGWGPREKRVVKGHSACMASLVGELAPDPESGRYPEVAICFKPYPPYTHFKRPGR
ncbi:hypothetical protein [Streptomyces sp. MBT53]|uniref:hypothetical protein n=1 Tax=Streptomyces sp. MBT53 TaxID=1488384 RepID=UPI001913C97B|nr:hypothetical protein [Streptomyces sp. MBT53]MBK6014896.1 hypothetical protein [Streptomyces sp. MBT53]